MSLFNKYNGINTWYKDDFFQLFYWFQWEKEFPKIVGHDQKWPF